MQQRLKKKLIYLFVHSKLIYWALLYTRHGIRSGNIKVNQVAVFVFYLGAPKEDNGQL